MPNPTHITVTAPAGRLTPVHHQDGTEPGGIPLRVAPGFVHRVRYSQDIRRSIKRGDLVPCNLEGQTVGLELAAAPNDLPDGRIDLAQRDSKPSKVTP